MTRIIAANFALIIDNKFHLNPRWSSEYWHTRTAPVKAAFLLFAAAAAANFTFAARAIGGIGIAHPIVVIMAIKENLKKAKRKYSSSIEAKLDHRDRNRVYRQRRRDGQGVTAKSVTDKSSAVPPAQIKTPFTSGYCIVCGRRFILAGEPGENMELQFFNPH